MFNPRGIQIGARSLFTVDWEGRGPRGERVSVIHLTFLAFHRNSSVASVTSNFLLTEFDAGPLESASVSVGHHLLLVCVCVLSLIHI